MYPDGGGLWMQVTRGVARQRCQSWIFWYTINGRRRQMGLGSLTTVSLSEAREQALQCRKLVHAGIDPIEQRNAERAARAAATLRTMTFDGCIGAYVAAHRDAWRSDKHAKYWDRPLRQLSVRCSASCRSPRLIRRH
jgi:hypothetical protein